jgi:hypothetical protein
MSFPSPRPSYDTDEAVAIIAKWKHTSSHPEHLLRLAHMYEDDDSCDDKFSAAELLELMDIFQQAAENCDKAYVHDVGAFLRAHRDRLQDILCIKFAPARLHIAIDVGGVIICKDDPHGDDTNFDVNNVDWMPGVFSSIAQLHLAGHHLCILSFAGKRHEQATRQALRTSPIVRYIPESQWHFVRHINAKPRIMKKEHCHLLIDDRSDTIDRVHVKGMRGVLFINWQRALQEVAMVRR